MPETRTSSHRTLLAFACVYLCWGSTYGAIRIAGLHIPPPLVVASRSLISTVLIGGTCLARGTSLRVSRRVAWQLILVGILFMSVNNVLLTWAETRVATGFAALVIAMIPIFVAVIESALPSGERMNLGGWAGTLLGVVGMVALLWPTLHAAFAGNQTIASTNLLAFGALILAALAFAIGSILARRFDFQVDTFVATTWQIGAAGLLNLAIAATSGNFSHAVWTRSGLLAILYLSIVGSVVGLTAYTYLLKHVAVTKVSTYAFVNPVIAVLLGVTLLHEHMSAAEITGMVIIVAAVAMVILSRSRPVAPAEALPPLLATQPEQR